MCLKQKCVLPSWMCPPCALRHILHIPIIKKIYKYFLLLSGLCQNPVSHCNVLSALSLHFILFFSVLGLFQLLQLLVYAASHLQGAFILWTLRQTANLFNAKYRSLSTALHASTSTVLCYCTVLSHRAVFQYCMGTISLFYSIYETHNLATLGM